VWRQAVENARIYGNFQSMASDYLLFILFSGLRRREAASLRWEQVDLNHKTVRIFDTKNGKPLTLPLSKPLIEVLLSRKLFGESVWVFPGSVPGKPIVEPKGHVRRVSQMSGVSFTVHDLRRTFITVAESLDISKTAIQALVNHSGAGVDVTDGYVIMDESRLREPMEKIAQKMMGYMG
jgi:integrase